MGVLCVVGERRIVLRFVIHYVHNDRGTRLTRFGIISSRNIVPPYDSRRRWSSSPALPFQNQINLAQSQVNLILSGSGESNSGHTVPNRVHYHYATPRMKREAKVYFRLGSECGVKTFVYTPRQWVSWRVSSQGNEACDRSWPNDERMKALFTPHHSRAIIALSTKKIERLTYFALQNVVSYDNWHTKHCIYVSRHTTFRPQIGGNSNQQSQSLFVNCLCGEILILVHQ